MNGTNKPTIALEYLSSCPWTRLPDGAGHLRLPPPPAPLSRANSACSTDNSAAEDTPPTRTQSTERLQVPLQLDVSEYCCTLLLLRILTHTCLTPTDLGWAGRCLREWRTRRDENGEGWPIFFRDQTDRSVCCAVAAVSIVPASPVLTPHLSRDRSSWSVKRWCEVVVHRLDKCSGQPTRGGTHTA